MTIADFTDVERLAFGGLIRLLVAADNQYSREEADALADLSEDLGADLWALVEAAAQHFEGVEQIRAAAADVHRPEVKELIYGALLGIGQRGTLGEGEQSLLDWLAQLWKLDEGGVPYR